MTALTSHGRGYQPQPLEEGGLGNNLSKAVAPGIKLITISYALLGP